MNDAQSCDEELLRKLDSAVSPKVSSMLNCYFVAALCESAAARLRFKDAAIDNLSAEVERLQEEVAMYRSALANALEIPQPMPAPPEKEE